jgi:hypothetical protein
MDDEKDLCKPLLERIMQLNEENDLLATANVELHKQVADLKKELERYTMKDLGVDGEVSSREELPPATAQKKGPERLDLLPLPKLIVDDTASSGTYAKTQVAKITDVCGNTNPICVAFCTGETHLRLAEQYQEKVMGASTLVLVGGVDKIVRVYAYSHETNEHNELFRVEVMAPVLGVTCCGDMAACAQMDGTVAVMHIPTASTHATSSTSSVPIAPASTWGQPGMTSHKRHSKYLACVAFNAKGDVMCAVCPAERAISLYRDGGSTRTWTFLASLTLDASPEGAIYVPEPVRADGVDGEVLVIALRESANLVALRGTTAFPDAHGDTSPLQFTEYRIPLNEHEWDSHASFSALGLAASTDCVTVEAAKGGICGPLVVSTDKGTHLLVAWEGSSPGGKLHSSNASLVAAVAAGVGGVDGQLRVVPSERVAMLHDHNCSEYGKPCVAWGSTEGKARFLYSNSEGESCIYVYDTLQARTRAVAGAQTNTSGSIGACGSVAKLQGHKGIVRGLASHTSLGLLASVSYDHTLVMWR